MRAAPSPAWAVCWGRRQQVQSAPSAQAGGRTSWGEQPELGGDRPPGAHTPGHPGVSPALLTPAAWASPSPRQNAPQIRRPEVFWLVGWLGLGGGLAFGFCFFFFFFCRNREWTHDLKHKCCATWANTLPTLALLFVLCFWGRILLPVPGPASNSWSFCLHLLSSWITGMNYHTQPKVLVLWVGLLNSNKLKLNNVFFCNRKINRPDIPNLKTGAHSSLPFQNGLNHYPIYILLILYFFWRSTSLLKYTLFDIWTVSLGFLSSFILKGNTFLLIKLIMFEYLALR
jgi:hypothetical protein